MKLKKLLAGVLSVLVWRTTLPVTGFSFTPEYSTVPIISTSAKTAELSGKCGEYAEFTLKNGVVRISGTGETFNYTDDSPAPWNEFADEIRFAVVEDGITALGNQAFSGAVNLETVILPDSMRSIGDFAFSNCTSVHDLVIPSSLERFGSYVFYRCGLQNAWFTKSEGDCGELARIDNFYGSPAAVHFNACAGTAGDSCQWFLPKNGGILRIQGCGAVKDYSEGEAPWTSLADIITDIDLSDDIDALGNYAFSGLFRVTALPLHKLHSIGDGTFKGCSAVTTAVLPDTLTHIGSSAFDTGNHIVICGMAGSQAQSYAQNCSLDFQEIDGICGNNVGYKLSGTAVELIGSGATYDYSVSPWENISAFLVGEGITSLGSYICCDQESLTHVKLCGTLRQIGSHAFSGCTSLRCMLLPEGLETVGDSAFSDCHNIEYLTIPETLGTVGDAALWTKYQSALKLLCCQGDGKFYSNIDFGENYNERFSDTPIANGAEWGYFGNNISWIFTPEDGVLRLFGEGEMPDSKPGSAPWYKFGSAVRCIEFDQRITSVGAYNFLGMSGITEINLPDGVKSLNTAAFRFCTSLRKVNLGNSLTSIGNYCFYACYDLNDADLPESVSSIGVQSFGRCSSLTLIKIPDGITSIGQCAFIDCPQLTVIYCPSEDAYIGEKAFGYLNDYDISDLQLIGFGPCAAQKYAEENGIPYTSADGVCGESAVYLFDQETGSFYVYGSGETYDYNNRKTPVDGVKQPDWAEYRDQIRHVYFSDRITGIGNFFMYGAENLESIQLPAQLRSIGQSAFGNCKNTESVKFPENLEFMGLSSFTGCTSLKKFIFDGDAPQVDDHFTNNQFTTVYCHFQRAGWSSLQSGTAMPESTEWVDLDTVLESRTLSVSEPPGTISIGKEYPLTLEYDPRIATDFTWSSSAPQIVQVSGNGVISAFSEGIARITVKAKNDPSYSFSFMVTAEDSEGREKEITHKVNLDGIISKNISSNNYTIHTDRVNSFFFENSDGTFTRLENLGDSQIIRETYSPDFKLISSTTMDIQLERLAGFHQSENYFFLVFVQDNPEMDDSKPIFRIVRYNSDWSDPVTCDIAGIEAVNTAYSVARICESAENLYIVTSRGGYDGHEYRIILVVDKETMTLKSNSVGGAVSHSFNEFTSHDGRFIYTADHGDVNPRDVIVYRFSADIFDKINLIQRSALDILVEGYNDTGVSVGGFEVSDSTVLTAGNSVEQVSGGSAEGQRNIFLSVLNKELANRRIIWLTSYPEGSGISPRTPHLVKINNNTYLVMWEEVDDLGNFTTWLCITDQNGELLMKPKSTDMRLSDCKPLVTSSGSVVWYVTNNTKPVLYVLHPYSEQEFRTNQVDFDFDEELGVLTISGNGYIPEYSSPELRPWNSYADSVESIVVQGQIFTLGDGIFSGMKSLKNVLFDSVTYVIGDKAFADCPELQNVVLPESLYLLGNSPFSGDDSLERILISSGLRIAQPRSFYQNDARLWFSGTSTAWEELTAQLSPEARLEKTVSNGAEWGKCGKSAFWVYDPASRTIELFGSGDVDAFEAYPWAGYSLKASSIIIDQGITFIPDNAFRGFQRLRRVTAPESLRSIGSGAFGDCGNLSYFVARQSLENIGKDAFNGELTIYACEGSAAQTYAQSNGISFSAIDGYCGDDLVYRTDSGVLTIYGSGDMYDYGEGGAPWYSAHEEITSVILPENLTSVGEHAFDGMLCLKTVEIPSKVRQIRAYAFHNTRDLRDIYIRTVDFELGFDAFFNTYGAARDFYFAGTEPLWLTLTGEEENSDNQTIHYSYWGDISVDLPLVIETEPVSTSTTTTTSTSTTSTTTTTSTSTTSTTTSTSTTTTTSTSSTSTTTTTSTSSTSTTTTTSTSSTSTTTTTSTSSTSTTTTTSTSSTSTTTTTSTSSTSTTTTTSTSSTSTTTTTSTSSTSTTTTTSTSSTSTTTTTSTSTTSTTTTTSTSSTSTTTAAVTTVPESTTEVSYELGDIDMNGSVNSIDASEILRIYALISTGKQPDLTPFQLELADTNSDGDISSTDASLVLKYYSAISTGIFRTFREFLSEMT